MWVMQQLVLVFARYQLLIYHASHVHPGAGGTERITDVTKDLCQTLVDRGL